MPHKHRIAIGIWLTMMLVGLLIISRSHFTADLSAFLPSSPTQKQQLLMDQLKDGLASRLILVGIEGADEATHAAISKTMAQNLRKDPTFVTVNNGEALTTDQDRNYLFKHRYLLSPAVTPERFTAQGLHEAISDSIDQLASPAGLLLKSLLPHDPTGEMLNLLDQMNAGNRPQLIEGVWASRDGKTALMLLQTRALGSDTDAQKLAMQAIEEAFQQSEHATKAKLQMTGPGVFSVVARDTIKLQVRIIFIVSSLLIAALLWVVYRSFSALLLGFLPVATGIVAGVAAVSLGFGVVHGITLGFGTALIGEAVDYSIYLFMQSEHGTQDKTRQHRDWVQKVWPTVRLGMLTSVFGFVALLWSGFPGLAQLGLYSIAGLVAAAIMTRYVLPHLLPANFKVQDVQLAGTRIAHYATRLRTFKWPSLALLLAAAVVVYLHHDHLWNTELAALSPVSKADQQLDARLRAGMGAPDVRYVIVTTGHSQEAVLQATEKVAKALGPMIEEGALEAFDSASHYLPSTALQKNRLAALPEPSVLKDYLSTAVKDLPVRAAVFQPFLADIEAARQLPLLHRKDLEGTSMAMAVDAMLLQQGQRWTGLMPLTAVAGQALPADRIQTAIKSIPDTLFVDMKLESDHLYSAYMQEAMWLSLAGLAAIVLLLLLMLRSIPQVMAIILPLAAAVLVVTAGLVLAGQQLIILHLIGMLLIVAIGSNYALFFNPPSSQYTASITPQTYASLLFANIATVLGFGLLAFSTVPVLQAMGMTVAPGVILALVFSAVFARQPLTKAKA